MKQASLSVACLLQHTDVLFGSVSIVGVELSKK